DALRARRTGRLGDAGQARTEPAPVRRLRGGARGPAARRSGRRRPGRVREGGEAFRPGDRRARRDHASRHHGAPRRRWPAARHPHPYPRTGREGPAPGARARRRPRDRPAVRRPCPAALRACAGTAVTDAVQQLPRAKLAALAREYLLAGHMIDRAGMPYVVKEFGLPAMRDVAIEEWMSASPVYTRRIRRALGFAGDDVATIFKGMQFDIGAPH